jgi:hypothetical protein
VKLLFWSQNGHELSASVKFNASAICLAAASSKPGMTWE